MSWSDSVAFDVLQGKTLKDVQVVDDEEIYFKTTDGEKFKMYHEQDCCEGVYIEDVIGDWADVIGSPILRAEERVSCSVDDDCPPAKSEGGWAYDSFTWTFYTIRTIKGTVDLRWYGSSNGYYSESVDFKRIR